MKSTRGHAEQCQLAEAAQRPQVNCRDGAADACQIKCLQRAQQLHGLDDARRERPRHAHLKAGQVLHLKAGKVQALLIIKVQLQIEVVFLEPFTNVSLYAQNGVDDGEAKNLPPGRQVTSGANSMVKQHNTKQYFSIVALGSKRK